MASEINLTTIPPDMQDIVKKYPELYNTYIVSIPEYSMKSQLLKFPIYELLDQMQKVLYVKYNTKYAIKNTIDNIHLTDIKKLKLTSELCYNLAISKIQTYDELLNSTNMYQKLNEICIRSMGNYYCITMDKMKEFLTTFYAFYAMPILKMLNIATRITRVLCYPHFKIDMYTECPYDLCKIITRRRTVSDIMTLLDDYPYDVIIVGLTKTDDFGNELDIDAVKKFGFSLC